jgi:hypothetical protein
MSIYRYSEQGVRVVARKAAKRSAMGMLLAAFAGLSIFVTSGQSSDVAGVIATPA